MNHRSESSNPSSSAAHINHGLALLMPTNERHNLAFGELTLSHNFSILTNYGFSINNR